MHHSFFRHTGIRRIRPILGCFLCWPAMAAPIPAFPGAEGFGAHSLGGRGGDVYVVTNLNRDGAGSFAEGVRSATAKGRTIVFAVSGFIPIHKLRITQPRLTIAGQTAPGGGICLRGSSLTISAADVVIRHVRFRHGKDGSGGDCINPDDQAANLIIDHCDVMFGADENFSSFRTTTPSMTFSWSTNAWGIYGHSCGGLWNMGHATAHHTLWANNKTRNPKVIHPQLLDWINNVTFSWDIGMNLAAADVPGTYKVNLIGSSFIHGEKKGNAVFGGGRLPDGSVPYQVFIRDCALDGNGAKAPDVTATDAGIIDPKCVYQRSPVPFPPTLGADPAKPGHEPLGVAVTVDDRETALCKVLSQVGPLRMDAESPMPLRDEVTTLLVSDVMAQTRRKIMHERETGAANGGFGELPSTKAPADRDADGMPDFWESALGGDPDKADSNSPAARVTFFPPGTPAGYTALEEYLHFLATPHVVVAPGRTVTLKLDKFTAGFRDRPEFAIGSVVGGTVRQTRPGSGEVTFTADRPVTRRSGFDFTVRDAGGRRWTQRCSVLVAAD